MSAEARRAVLAAIPHRDPFLFVDAVEERGEGWLVARWRVPPEAEWFRGHYPGEPVLPGVLLCEHCFQSGALLVAPADAPASGAIPVLARIEDARFRRIVRPGETLVTRVELREALGPARFLAARVACAGARVAQVRFVLSAAAAAGGEEDA